MINSGVGDALMPPGLLDAMPEGDPIASATTDGAYAERACRDAITGRGADAIIPPRRNAKPWRKDSRVTLGSTRPCAPSSASAGRPSAAGAATTAGADSRPDDLHEDA